MVDEIREVQYIGSSELDEIRNIVISHNNLSDIVRWIASTEENKVISDVIVQDEYTHDVLVNYKEKIYLVYDVT